MVESGILLDYIVVDGAERMLDVLGFDAACAGVDAVVTFCVVLYLTRRWGWKVALASAVIGTAAAPMFFEFPFDLIVMARTNPPSGSAVPGIRPIKVIRLMAWP